MEFFVGQRWISNTEAQLGLGIVTEVSGRLVNISFPAAEEERTYAADSAPLSRVIYNPGDQVSTHDDEILTVTDLAEEEGLIAYATRDATGQTQHISELQLSCFVELTTPEQRLLCGQFDANSAYQLRIDTINRIHQLQQSGCRGLMGSRTSLLHHQIYIANEVAQRHAPRVLLADEVGLGKTIEAGMILHQQLLTGRANRALVVVPANLQHQWLVEMLRRFNLRFALFNEERLLALKENTAENPFETAQLVICSLDFVTHAPDAREFACAAGWDLLIVDEAHHLGWSEQHSSPSYECVAELASVSRGLLLLTATPEQAGVDGHFARLRLLDPDRFHDLTAFKQEEAGYQALNGLVRELLSKHGELTTDGAQRLQGYLGDTALALGEESPFDTDKVVDQLLDYHGTGRVLFRNTRTAIKNFPTRLLRPYPLPKPEFYGQDRADIVAALYPETAHEEETWLAADPRVAWLQELLKTLRPAKVLVICSRADTAVALEHHLHLRVGIRSAAFYEGLSIIERDSAAAYFAEPEAGAQTLICSEIGSEGRNFQFAQHLVLFDLPLNPDLLEQRIGRLDRIGQHNDIHIHVPYLCDTAQEVLFHWYEEGMGIFTASCAAGYAIYKKFEETLQQQLMAPDDGLARLMRSTADFTALTRRQLQEGRDQLLELSSCKPAQAAALIKSIELQEDPVQLATYMEAMFEHYGVEQDYHSEHSWVLRPGDHMMGEHFPGLKAEGNTVTFDRDKALVREDMEFLSWEHPMVHDAMDMLLHGEFGNATVTTIKIKGLATGTLLLEAVYTVNCIAPRAMQLEKYLPLSPIRVIVDKQGKDLCRVLSFSQLNQLCLPIKKKTAQAVIKQIRSDVETMLLHTNNVANKSLPTILDEAQTALAGAMTREIARLKTLQTHNPSIRQEEIDHLLDTAEEGVAHINHASLQLQGIRVVVNT
jgi:ATP-dependent helicase HepA